MSGYTSDLSEPFRPSGRMTPKLTSAHKPPLCQGLTLLISESNDCSFLVYSVEEKAGQKSLLTVLIEGTRTLDILSL